MKTKYYVAEEFDLRRGEHTGHRMVFLTDSLEDAAKSCAYTLNLSMAGWKVATPSRLAKKYITVARMHGDISWSVQHLREGDL